MVNFAAQVLAIVVSVMFAIQLNGDIPTSLTVGLLLCIGITALGEVLPKRYWMMACIAFCIVTMWIPVWLVFFPALACNFVYCAESEDACIPRGLRPWCYVIISVLIMGKVCLPIIQYDIAWDARYVQSMLTYWILIMLTILASIVGWVRARNQQSEAKYRAIADIQRERLRLSRTRVSDIEAARSADLHRARLHERTRIAREIHDNVGHVLTRAIMMTQAHQVVANSVGDTNHATQFGEIGTVLDEAMTTIRRSVHDLKDEGTDFNAMIEDASTVANTAALEVRIHNGIDRAPSALAHCFAAIIRESLTNTLRHGTASFATIRLIEFPGLWQLIVQDNGGTVSSQKIMGSDGIGLTDIEERAHALGGNATWGPYADGWRVFVSIPKTGC